MPQQKQSTAPIRLSLAGGAVAAFREVTGLDSETEVVEYREAGSAEIRKVPGVLKWSDVTLSRYADDDTTLFEWRESVIAGEAEARTDGCIELIDFEGQPIARYNLKGAWPAKYSVSQTTDSGSIEAAIESITIAHEGFERV